ncbi:hypothetical protein BRADI_2g57406v3, partial [Brachypodium distachyon]
LGWRAAAVRIAASLGGASGSSGRIGQWQLRGAARERRCVAATGDAAGRLDPRRHRRLQPRRWLQRRRLGPERGEARQARAGGLARARRAQGLLLQRLDLSRDFTAAAGGDVACSDVAGVIKSCLRFGWSWREASLGDGGRLDDDWGHRVLGEGEAAHPARPSRARNPDIDRRRQRLRLSLSGEELGVSPPAKRIPATERRIPPLPPLLPGWRRPLAPHDVIVQGQALRR